MASKPDPKDKDKKPDDKSKDKGKVRTMAVPESPHDDQGYDPSIIPVEPIPD